MVKRMRPMLNISLSKGSSMLSCGYVKEVICSQRYLSPGTDGDKNFMGDSCY